VAEQRSTGSERASLHDFDPGLAALLGPDGAESVGREPLMPVVRAPAGRWARPGAALPAHTAALGVLDGLLLRETAEPGGAALSGPGDLVEPWPLRPELRWTACLPLRLAAIGPALLSGLRPWPQVAAALLSRALSQESGQLEALAIGARHGDDQRLLGQLGRLARRWGRATAGGTVVPLPLAPDQLGRLAGVAPGSARALLHALSERGLAVQRTDGSWLVRSPAARATPAPRPTTRGRGEPDERRKALIAAFARASDAHVEALATTRELAGRLGAPARAQPPAVTDWRSE
jgi:hypothetical protein